VLYGGTGNDVLAGGGGDNRLYGEAGDDRLIGNVGRDTLNGGSGADRMEGGNGDDYYYVDSTLDQIVESSLPNGGNDTIRSSINYDLTPSGPPWVQENVALIENLVLVDGAAMGRGNASANHIWGNANDNLLYGLEGNQGLAPKALATSVGITPMGRVIVADNAGYFASQANLRLASAVQAANVPLNPNRIFFANPGFGPTNAANASNAWVFGLSGGLIPNPTDSSASLNRRVSQCASVYNPSSFDYMFCRLASAGHPNETGAVKYFNAIQPFL